MGRKEDNAKKAVELMKDQTHIRNLGTAAHIDHGKTTFSDNLIAGAGMMSSETAGEQRLLDYDEQEAPGVSRSTPHPRPWSFLTRTPRARSSTTTWST